MTRIPQRTFESPVQFLNRGTTTISPTVVSRAMGIINVQASPYNAQGDGVTDDTAAIQSAFDAAAVIAAAGGFPLVFIPEGTYIVGTGVAAGKSALEYDGDELIIRGPGRLKLAAGSGADAVLLISGDFSTVQDITIDGNASGSPSGRGEGLRVTGNYNIVTGVTSQTTKTTGSTGATFIINGGIGNTLRDCYSFSSGYSAYRLAGDFTKMRNCYAINHLAHGISTAGNDLESIDIDGYYSTGGPDTTTYAGALFDQGKSGTTGYMIRRLSLRNVIVNSGASGYVPIKITRCHEAYLENVHVYHSSTASSLKLAEDIGKLVVKDSYFSRVIDQDQSPNDPTGTISDTASNGGFVQFTSTSHGVVTNSYIVVDGTTSYDGLHLVTAVSGSTFTTNRKWVANSETGTFYNVIGEISLENVTVGDRTHNIAGAFSGVRAHRLFVDRCDFRGYREFAIGLDTDLSSANVFDKIEVKNTRIESKDSSNAPWVIAWDAGHGTQDGQLLDSNVTRISGLDIVDVGSQSTRGVLGNSERIVSISANRTLTGIDSGATFIATAADLVITLPAVSACGAGVRYRFVLAASGLSTGTGLSISPSSTNKIMGNGFASAINKDAINTGATDAEGDSLEIVSDGSLGWYITAVRGTWAREA